MKLQRPKKSIIIFFYFGSTFIDCSYQTASYNSPSVKTIVTQKLEQVSSIIPSTSAAAKLRPT